MASQPVKKASYMARDFIFNSLTFSTRSAIRKVCNRQQPIKLMNGKV